MWSTQWQTEERAAVGRSNPEEKEGKNVSLLASIGRYGQVGENASAVLLSVLSATGLTVKEKLGGERECAAESGREWEVPDSERQGEGRVIYVLRCSILTA